MFKFIFKRRQGKREVLFSFALLFFLLLSISFVSAEWWNPFTWFDSSSGKIDDNLGNAQIVSTGKQWIVLKKEGMEKSNFRPVINKDQICFEFIGRSLEDVRSLRLELDSSISIVNDKYSDLLSKGKFCISAKDYERVKIGLNTIITEYQDLNMINYHDEDHDTNISLSCEGINQTDLFIYENPDNYKFGANGTFEGLANCTYNVKSTLDLRRFRDALVLNDGNCDGFLCGERHRFNFDDVCDREFDCENVTYQDCSSDPSCYGEYENGTEWVNETCVNETEVCVNKSRIECVDANCQFEQVSGGEWNVYFISNKSIDPEAEWFNESWTYRKEINISNSNVDSDLTDFPLYVYFNDSDIGGECLSTGHDIRFANASGDEIPYERESFTVEAGSGNAVGHFWVEVENVSSSEVTSIYIYYGNETADAGADGEDATNVWDDNFEAVWHLSEASGTIYDSTSNDHDSSSEAGVGYGQDCQTGNCLDWDGSDEYVQLPDSAGWDISSVTITAWIYPDNFGEGGFGRILNNQESDGQSGGWNTHIRTGDENFVFATYDNAGSSESDASDNSAISTGKWQYVSIRWNSTDVFFYIDAAAKGNSAHTVSASGTSDMYIGNRATDQSRCFDGRMDEIRISKDHTRSVDWIKFEFHNMNSTDHELTFGDEEAGEVVDEVYPIFSSPWDNNGTLENSGTGLFNITVTSTNGTVLLDINNTNQTATNLTASLFNASYSFTHAGTYTYRWCSWGNGTDSNFNCSEDYSYTVNSTENYLYSLQEVITAGNDRVNVTLEDYSFTEGDHLRLGEWNVNLGYNRTDMNGNDDLVGYWNLDSLDTYGYSEDNIDAYNDTLMYIKHGIWNWHNHPLVDYENNLLVTSYIDADLDVYVMSYNYTDGEVKTSMIKSNFGENDHSGAAVKFLTDGRIMAMAAEVRGDIFYRISSNPYDITSWEDEKNLTSLASLDSATYATIHYLSDEGLYYVLTRNNGGGDSNYYITTYNYTSDTWTAAEHFIDEPKYIESATNDDGDEIHFFFSWASTPFSNTDARYIKYKSGNFYYVNGTLIDSWDNLPLDYDVQTELVFDTSAYGSGSGDNRNWYAVVNSTGTPFLIHDYRDNSDGQHCYLYTYYNDSDWVTNNISAGGSCIGGSAVTVPSLVNGGGASIDPDNESIVYVSNCSTDDTCDILKLFTTDRGETWFISENKTDDSLIKNFMPHSFEDHPADLDVVWVGGQYNAHDDYHCSIFSDKGLMTNDRSTHSIYDNSSNTNGEYEEFLYCHNCSNVLNLTSEMTLSLWMYPNTDVSAGEEKYLIDRRINTGYTGYSLYVGEYNTNDIRFILGNTSANLTTSANAFSSGEWSHVVARYNGTDLEVFVNTESKGTDSFSGSYQAGGELLIGTNDKDGGDNVWNGSIDEVMIFNRSITDDEIEELYKKGRALWNFSEWEQIIDGTLTYKFNISELSTNLFTEINSTDEKEFNVSYELFGDPVVTIVTPSDNTNTTNTNLNVNFTRTDETALDTCWYSNDTMSLNTTLSTGANITSVTWAEGQHNVTIWCNDSSNNVGNDSVSFRIDTTYPLIDWIIPPTPANGSFINYTLMTENVSITETNTDNVTFRCFNLTGDCTTCGETTYLYDETAHQFDLIEDGYYLINVTICDGASNCNTTENIYFTVDTTDPSVDIVYPPNNTNSTDFSLEVNYTRDDINLDSCWWTDDDGDTNNTLTSCENFTDGGGWVECSNTVRVYVNDSAGNEGFDTVSFKIDSQPPVFDDIYNVSIYENQSVNEDFNASDNCLDLDSWVINNTDNFSIDSTGQFTNATGLENDIYYINITINDTLNHLNSIIIWVNVSAEVGADSTAPYFTGIPDNISQAYLTELGTNFNATDETALDTFVVNDSRFAINSSGWLSNATIFGVGEYTINITINDTSNNLNSTLFNYSVTQIISSVNLTLNNSQDNITIIEGDTIDINCSTINGDAGAYLSLHVKENHHNNGTSPIGNTTTFATPNVIVNATCFYQATQNYSASSETWFVNVTETPDTTFPNVTINIPTQNQNFSTDSVNFNVTAVDETAIDTCLFSIDDGETNYTMANISDEYNYTLSSISDGDYTATFYCNDTSNNLNNTETVDFTIDTTPPVVTNPRNFTQEVNQSFSEDMSATDAGVGIGTYSLNDTTYFNISSFGIISNSSNLSEVRIHWLNYSINDTLNNPHSFIFYINITEITVVEGVRIRRCTSLYVLYDNLNLPAIRLPKCEI